MHYRSVLSCLVLAIVLGCGCSKSTPAIDALTKTPAAGDTTFSPPEKLAAPHLPNAFRIHPKVISGGLPDGDAGFQELQALGVKTVISVDGAPPDVKLAKQHGLRYVHLPHGYDGIPEQRARELARAVRELEGPIYIHCHHGKHRSPAAATVACVSAGFLPHDAAAVILKAAGTSPNYRGLYEAAENARPLDVALLDQLRIDYREIAELPPITEAMVAIEHRHDHLKALFAAGWKVPSGSGSDAKQDPSHEALLLKEGFAELARTKAVREKPTRFRELLSDGERASDELEQALRHWTQTGGKPPAPAGIGLAFTRITKNCTACHVEYRDVPLGKQQN